MLEVHETCFIIACVVAAICSGIGFLFGWGIHKNLTARYLFGLLTYVPTEDITKMIALFASNSHRQWRFPWVKYHMKYRMNGTAAKTS